MLLIFVHLVFLPFDLPLLPIRGPSSCLSPRPPLLPRARFALLLSLLHLRTSLSRLLRHRPLIQQYTPSYPFLPFPLRALRHSSRPRGSQNKQLAHPSATTTTMSDSSPTPSRPSSAAGGASSSPSRPPIISRPSALSVRPQLGIQTRIRARSVGAGSGSSLPTSANLHLSPTLAGSPVLPGVESFLGGELMRDSPLARHEPVLAIGRRGSGGLSSGDEDDEEDAAGERTPGMEDGTGSTESDSPPSTPAHGSAAGAGVGSHSIPAFRVTKGDWRGQGLGLGEVQRNNRTMLEGSTRHNLRRGRSFTSLLIQPTTPPVERPDPIKEVHSPPLSDIESGGDDTTSSSYPPTTLPVPPRVEGPPKTIRDFLPQVAILLGLFLSSFAVIAALIATLPGLFLPHSVADLPTLTSSLSTYRASSTLAELHLFAVLTGTLRVSVLSDGELTSYTP